MDPAVRSWLDRTVTWRGHTESPQALLAFFKSCDPPPSPPGSVYEYMTVDIVMHLIMAGNVVELEEMLDDIPATTFTVAVVQMVDEKDKLTYTKEQLEVLWRRTALEDACRHGVLEIIIHNIPGFVEVCEIVPEFEHYTDATRPTVVSMFLHMLVGHVGETMAADFCAWLPQDPPRSFSSLLHVTLAAPYVFDGALDPIASMPVAYKTCRDKDDRTPCEAYLAKMTDHNPRLVAALSVFTKGAIHSH